jgi:hypothetical protein
MTSPEPGTYNPDVILVPAAVADEPGAIDRLNELLRPAGLRLGKPVETLAVLPVDGDVVAVRDVLAPEDSATDVTYPNAVSFSKPIPHVPVFLLHATSKPIPHGAHD